MAVKMLNPPLEEYPEPPKPPKEKMLEIPGHYFGKATQLGIFFSFPSATG